MQTPIPIDPTRHALFLDFDGTLVSFVDDPADAAIESDVLENLARLQERLGGALAIVSGRRIADLDRFLTPLAFAAAGVHGLEMRAVPGGPIVQRAGPEAMEHVRAALHAAVDIVGGLKLEDKGTALVLHFREHPELEETAKTLMASAVGGQSGLSVMAGNRIVEVHPAGIDKGVAVRALMGAAPFAGRVPVYVGDDTTDEFALEVVKTLGGLGIKVGEGDSAATARFADVSAVHEWLAAGCRAAVR